jgi:hypothetical protein
VFASWIFSLAKTYILETNLYIGNQLPSLAILHNVYFKIVSSYL